MEPISMTVDFIELMDYTVEITDRVLKVAHNVVRLEGSWDLKIEKYKLVINSQTSTPLPFQTKIFFKWWRV
jgi:hypothetical protein